MSREIVREKKTRNERQRNVLPLIKRSKIECSVLSFVKTIMIKQKQRK
jgi:hypothetical protein